MSKQLIKVICSPGSLVGNIVKYGVKNSLIRSTASTQIIFYEIIYLPFNDNEGSLRMLGNSIPRNHACLYKILYAKRS